jgi:hypothetical protein
MSDPRPRSRSECAPAREREDSPARARTLARSANIATTQRTRGSSCRRPRRVAKRRRRSLPWPLISRRGSPNPSRCLPAWASAQAAAETADERTMLDRCRSWPHCDQAPVPGGRFCAEHQATLHRVKESIASGGTFNQVRPLPASVKVRYVAPTAKPKRARKALAAAPKPRIDRTAAKAQAVEARTARHRESAVALAALVRERGRLNVAEAGALLGCGAGPVKRSAKIAVSEGWIVSRTGAPGGGYFPGDALPAAVAA